MKLITTKKAYSGIIVTVLLILIVLAFISLLFLYLKETIKPLESPINCIGYKLEDLLEINSLCLNKETGELEIEIERGINSNIKSFSLIIYNATEKAEYSCNADCPACDLLNKGETKRYFLKTINSPQFVEVFADNCFIEKRIIIFC